MNKDKNVKKFECPICNAIYTCQSKLKWHVKLVHQKKRPCNCSSCDATYSNEYDLWRHVSSIHEKEKPFICKLCQERYSQKTSLSTHMETSHGIKFEAKDTFSDREIPLEGSILKKKYCLECNKGFKDNWKLQRHEKQVHMKSKGCMDGESYDWW